MKISLKSSSSSWQKVSCFVLMMTKKGLEKQKSSPFARITKKVMEQKLFTGNKNEFLFLPCTPMGIAENVLLIGLGERQQVNAETIRQAASVACRRLEAHSQTSACLDFSLLTPFVKSQKTLATVISEGFLLSHYLFDELKTVDKKRVRLQQLVLLSVTNTKDVNQGLKEGAIVADSTNFARLLADRPPNLMTPTILAQAVQKKSRSTLGLKVQVWDKNRIKKENMGGILGVSAGSNKDPRVIIMEYKGSSRSSSQPLCFVGKGLTFDSGGISLKPPRNMDEMKFDMCGSVAVIGALLAIAQLKLKVNVIGIVGASENMPGAAATKPGDILTARNGKTMEVLNTDAEGRLVLADMLAYASEKKPAFIVDAATLTGAVTVALGNTYTGIFTRSKELEKQLHEAASVSGEQVWSLPLDDFHIKDIKSLVADVANISSTGLAGSSTAAAFLEHFVDKNIPWAHLDIAGTAYNVSARLPYCRPKSASGVMVRTFVELSRQYIR